MKTTMQSRSARPSAVAAVAVLAFWFTFGAAQIVRAEDSETLASPAHDMVLVPVKTVETLEQRVIFLEETVEALTESWQHIDTHRLCVSDDGGAETCITKAQLDVFLTQVAQAKISAPATSQQASVSAPAEPDAVVAETETSPVADPGTEPSSGPAIVVGENLPADQEPELTGSLKPASGAAVLSYPKVEIYEEPAARTEE
ncbi:MAG TPA: hypothetical protein VG291_08055 [Xanthobacteraceae bacterium]|nr:hypothetical protein [Xanthobacteraceae bacterium]